MTSFQEKCALVTGGNRGIGFAICQGLLSQGFEVIMAARSLDKAKTAIARKGGRYGNLVSHGSTSKFKRKTISRSQRSVLLEESSPCCVLTICLL
jgi:NAD(P)-dependent dehydrogenase (short-subunit alcohol dehydrogenase family)